MFFKKKRKEKFKEMDQFVVVVFFIGKECLS